MADVVTDDGARLHVEEHGAADAPVTVVLGHGWTLDRRTWQHQAAALPEVTDGVARVVAYDHRGHGGSSVTTAERATIDQLADDLAAVVTARAPTGPVVLGGHSIGGMTIMALAQRHPELFASRVAGVLFVATSSGQLDRRTYRPRSPVARAFWWAEDAWSRRIARRGVMPGVPAALLRPGLTWLLFGQAPQREATRLTATQFAACSAVTYAGFRASLAVHDRLAALAAFRTVPVVVLAGTRDRLCPLSHSRTIAAELPDAQLTVFPGAGHMLPLERPTEVTAALATLTRTALNMPH